MDNFLSLFSVLLPKNCLALYMIMTLSIITILIVDNFSLDSNCDKLNFFFTIAFERKEERQILLLQIWTSDNYMIYMGSNRETTQILLSNCWKINYLIVHTKNVCILGAPITFSSSVFIFILLIL